MRWLAAVVCALAIVAVASAQSQKLAAELDCPPRADAGRVVCRLTLASDAGRIVWADALVIETPSFVRPLRSRVVGEVPAQGTAVARLPVAFVAEKQGKTQVSVRGRAVLCQERRTRGASGGRTCWTASRTISAAVVIAARD